MPLDYSPFSDALRADPYPTYRRLREEAPVYWATDPGAWVVSRYDQVVQVLKQPELFSSDAMATALMGVSPTAIVDPGSDPQAMRNVLALAQALPFETAELGRGRGLINSDPPQHDELRTVVNRGFTPRRIQAWETRIRELVSGCMEGLRRGESFDLIGDLAIPVPTIVIAELLGVDAERREDFKRWSDGIMQGITGSRRGLGFAESGAVEAMGEFARYFVQVAEERRRDPRDDLATVLLRAEGGEKGLTPQELVMFALLLLVAGNETTTNLIGNSVNALLDHPDQLERVRSDPALLPSLVEESLRYDGPVQFLFRRSTRPQELGGEKIEHNQVVVALLGSANRDERHWGPDADRFDVSRNASGHLGFGFGLHFCLGAALARLEARCSLAELIDVLPRLRRADASVRYVDSYLMRGPERLELVAA